MMSDTNNKQSWLKRRVANTGDSEPEQIFLRLTIGVLLIIYFCFPWAHGESFYAAITELPSLIALGYYFCAMFIAGGLLLYPMQSPIRRTAGIFLDLVSLSLVMFISGAESIFIFVLYMWVILGNGFRYGLNYLYVSQMVGVVGFFVAITWGEYWQLEATQPIAASLLFILAIIPIFCASLIKKLHKAISDSKQANEAKTKFLASMSHELRTPLNGVIGLGDLLRETKLDKEQQDLVKTMHQSAYILLGLIEKVLDISKIEAGKLVISHERLDLHVLVNSVISIKSVIGSTKGLTVNCDMDFNVPFLLKGDELHLKQVLVNLIGNAIKFTDAGTVTLNVKRVEQDNEETIIRFEVKDTGIGSCADLLPIVFDDFTQVSGSAQSTIVGTGLGTTISKELVELMGGRIGVESELGIGSMFWFELPFTEIAHDSLDISDNHLLLICSEDVKQSLSPLLEGWHVEYDVAKSPVHAITMLSSAVEQDKPYKVVLIDNDALLNTSPVEFAETIQLETQLTELSLILVNYDERIFDRASAKNYYISMISSLNDKRLLFNAIHAAQTIHVDSHNVISIADYYENQQGAQSLNILVAEDNQVNQQVIEGILKRAGHNVILADDGEIALDILTRDIDSVDLFIVDKNMPERSGDEVVKALRFFDTQRTLPVIMLTADATPEARAASMLIGVDLFLTKPVDSRDLLEKIAVLSQNIESPSQKSVRPSIVSDFSSSNHSSHKVAVAEELLEDTANHWFDEAMFNELLVLDRDPSFIRRLVNGFIADGDKHVSRISTSASDDYLQFRESLHALKGSASELGATRLSDVCRQGEGYKPYDIGSAELITLSKSIEHIYSHTVSALDNAATIAENAS
jgi:two-component system sensor histidine kinase RpfC